MSVYTINSFKDKIIFKAKRILFLSKYFFDITKYNLTNQDKITFSKEKFFIDFKNANLKLSIDNDNKFLLIADPFIRYYNNEFYLFVEIIEGDEKYIAVATSVNGENFKYKGACLKEEDIVFSYPYVFEYNNKFYMYPEQRNRKKEATNYLYETTKEKFPFGWKRKCELFKTFGEDLNDKVIFNYKNHWYILAGSGGRKLVCYHSKNLFSNWELHPSAPLLMGKNISTRPGGDIIFHKNKIILMLQNDGKLGYGEYITPMYIDKISPKNIKFHLGDKIRGEDININNFKSSKTHHFSLTKTNDTYYYVTDNYVKINKEWKFLTFNGSEKNE